jgi:ATP-dependent exoDNAse (exonuclease V) beta subunit
MNPSSSEELLCSKTIPSGEVEGIRIFSIHKSKGLEFHTVLLPFCDWKLENETNNQLVWCAPQTAPFNTLDILPINYYTQMAESIYGNDYLQERLQLWVDNLNLLYVALTRAGKNLIIWSRKKQKGTMSELLANTLPIVAQEEGIDWEEDCYEQGQLCPSEKERIKTSTNKLTQKPEKLPIRMESMRHDIEFRQSNRSADFIRASIQTIKQGAIRSITCCIKFVTTILDKVFTSINYLVQILFCIRHITIFTISSLIQSCTSLKG